MSALLRSTKLTQEKYQRVFGAKAAEKRWAPSRAIGKDPHSHHAAARTVSGIGSGLFALLRNSMVEDHILIADIFEIVNLILAGPIGLVPGLAGLIGVFDRRAVMYMLASTSAVHRGPEIIEHVAVETDPLAGSEPNDPHPHALAFREESRADAAVVVKALAVDFSSDRT
jgi:hypothetical protein